MIRFTWRQFRAQAVLTSGALAIAAIVMVVSGLRLAQLYNKTIGTCPSLDSCRWPTGVVSSSFGSLGGGIAAVAFVLPALLGTFWGAPLVAREFETGTYRLAWTQGVARERWLAAKLAVGGLASIGIAGAFGLVAGWWANPHNVVTDGRFVPGQFDVQGIVLAGYAAFAFAAGVAAGVLIRRTLPAMAAGLAAFAGLRVLIGQSVRPHFAAPLHLKIPLTAGGGPKLTPTADGGLVIWIDPPHLQNAWIYSVRAVDRAGHGPANSFLRRACPNLLASGHAPTVHKEVQQSGGMPGCLSRLSAQLHGVVTYQPASRYWLFQGYETAIFAGLAVLLVLVSFWWLRRRLS